MSGFLHCTWYIKCLKIHLLISEIVTCPSVTRSLVEVDLLQASGLPKASGLPEASGLPKASGLLQASGLLEAPCLGEVLVDAYDGYIVYTVRHRASQIEETM